MCVCVGVRACMCARVLACMCVSFAFLFVRSLTGSFPWQSLFLVFFAINAGLVCVLCEVCIETAERSAECEALSPILQ